MLTIDNFKAAIANANTGVVNIRDGHVVLLNGKHQARVAGDATNADVNFAARRELVNALVADSGSSVEYLNRLTSELLGNNSGEALTCKMTKSLLDRHVMMKHSLEGFSSKSAVETNGMNPFVSSGNDAPNTSGVNRFIADAGRETLSAAITSAEVKKILAQLPMDLSKTFVKAIKDEAKAAEASFKKCCNLKGSQLLSEKGLASLEKAAEDLSKLGADLQRLYNGLVRKDADIPFGLEGMMASCSARLSELSSLRVEFDGKANLPDAEKKMSVRTLLADRATTMHGADDFVRVLSGKSTELTQKLDALSDNPDRVRTADELNDIKQEIRQLRSTVAQVGSVGFDAGHGVIRVERSLAEGLMRTLDALDARICTLQDRPPVCKLAKTLIDSLLDCDNCACPDSDVRRTMSTVNEQISRTIKADGSFDRNRFEVIKEYVTNLGLNTYLVGFPKVLTEKGLDLLGDRLSSLCKHGANAGTPVTGTHLSMLVDGKARVGTIIGASAHGFPPDMIDARLDDDNLIRKRNLGSGAVNTVTEVTYGFRNENGDVQQVTRVFKPEETGRMISMGMAAGSRGYVNANRAAYINRASASAAGFLGAGSVIGKITVGMHNNQIGFFMEKAESMSFSSVKSMCKKNPVTKGTLLRELNKLEWTDWLTGQLDRHDKNYLVHVDDRGETHVKGIDNDFAFSNVKCGRSKFRMSMNDISIFIELAKERGLLKLKQDEVLFEKAFPGLKVSRFEGTNDCLIDIGGVANDRKNSLRDDVMNIVCDIYGINSMPKPGVISRTMHTKLMEYGRLDDKARKAEVKRMMGKGFAGDQILATKMRLDEMTEYAKNMANERIIDDEAWTNPATMARIEKWERNATADEGNDWATNYYYRDFS